MPQTLGQLAQLLGAKLVGDADLQIQRLATFDGAQSGDITFVSDKKLLENLSQCNASAIVLPLSEQDTYQGNALFMEVPYIGYAMLARIFDTTHNLPTNIAASAVISETATIGQNVAIAENVVVGANATISDNCQLFANVVIGVNASIGENTKIYPNVSVYSESVIGKRCIIHANTVIGSDGFGNVPYQGAWVKIPQIGKAVIGDDVEIGSSCTVDRGALSDTIIHNGVRIDNQCHIAHNVVIGEHSVFAGGASVAGSTVFGKNCMVGGCAVINGHITLADNVTITGYSMVVKSISEAGVYSSGTPAVENKKWTRNTAFTLKIQDLFKRVKSLERQLKNKE